MTKFQYNILLCRKTLLPVENLLANYMVAGRGYVMYPCNLFSQQWFEDNVVNTAEKLDAVFFATPHEFSADWAQLFVDYGVKVFDLSGGFRLKKNQQITLPIMALSMRMSMLWLKQNMA